MFIGTDANMVEVNPLILTKEEKIICLDAKVNFDSNALFKHPEIMELRDLNEEDPTEIEASKHDLAYIKLDGSIGCMVNGAGLAMATMDIIKLYGSEPANFLDVGGGASKEQVSAALKIIIFFPHTIIYPVWSHGRLDRLFLGTLGAMPASAPARPLPCLYSTSICVT